MVALDADKVSLLSLRYRTALCEGDSLVVSSFMLMDASHFGFVFGCADSCSCYKVHQLSLREWTSLCEGVIARIIHFQLIVESFHHFHIDDGDCGCVMYHEHERWHDLLQIPFPKLDHFVSRDKNIFDEIFGLVRVLKFRLDSPNSLFLVVQVYSKFIASAFGIAFIIICSWKSIFSLLEYIHHRFTRECENTLLYFLCLKQAIFAYIQTHSVWSLVSVLKLRFLYL